VCDVAHRDVTDGDIFEHSAINSFESDSAAVFHDAVCDRDVPKSAVALSSKLNSAIARSFVIWTNPFISGVEQGAFFVAPGHVAISNGDVLGSARVTKGERTLRTNCVIAWRIDAAV